MFRASLLCDGINDDGHLVRGHQPPRPVPYGGLSVDVQGNRGQVITNAIVYFNGLPRLVNFLVTTCLIIWILVGIKILI